MKKILVFFLFVALLAGCHDAYTPEPPPVLLGKITASIDGKPYETTDLILLKYFPHDNTLLFATKVDDKYLSFIINNIELPVLKAVPQIPYVHPDVGFNIHYSIGINDLNSEDKAGYISQKGEWRLESKEGRHVKARFWVETANANQTKTIVIEGGTIDIILPDRHYSRY